MRSLLIALSLNIAVGTIARPESHYHEPGGERHRTLVWVLSGADALPGDDLEYLFPLLRGLVLLAESEFWAGFGDSIEEMDRRMTTLEPTKWKETKDSTRLQLGERMARHEFTQRSAEEFHAIGSCPGEG